MGIPTPRPAILKERRENSIEALSENSIMIKTRAQVVTSKVPKVNGANPVQQNAKEPLKSIPPALKRGRQRNKQPSGSVLPVTNDMRPKLRSDPKNKLPNAIASRMGFNEITKGLNITESVKENEDNLTRKITCVTRPAVPILSVSQKRTRVLPPPTQNAATMQPHQKISGGPSDSSRNRNQQKMKKRNRRKNGGKVQYADDFDDCDCLRRNCTGCHFPCKTCGDSRCGLECRVRRRWIYESIEICETDEEFKNTHVNAFA